MTISTAPRVRILPDDDIASHHIAPRDVASR